MKKQVNPLKIHTKLSNSPSELKSHYDVVIIGSGYGGAVAAEKFSKQGLQVCVLERGKEWHSGQFPRSLKETALCTRIENKNFHFGKNSSLYNWNQNKGLLVLRGVGLGGGSLINAAVVVRPEENFLDEAGWPQGIKSQRQKIFESFSRIEKILKVSTYPAANGPLAKTRVFEKACHDLGSQFNLAPLAITFDSKSSSQNPCTNCGECMSGCNESAKNSLDQNFLKMAKAHGAKIFTEITVDHLKRTAQGNWRINLTHSHRSSPVTSIEAKHVVVAAGVLGSAEILLRSKKKGLALSHKLGHSFSGNNCTFGSISYTGQSPNIVGRSDASGEVPGPCITAYSKVNKGPHPFILEDGTIPSFITQIMAMGPFLATLERPSWFRSLSTKEHWQRSLSDLQAIVSKGKKGTINDSMIFLMAGKDSSSGVLEINPEGQIYAKWEKSASEKSLGHQMNVIRDLAKKWKGCYSNQALWNENGMKNKITVHPLGGCRMADSSEEGVVNWQGKVFTGHGDETYPNLYVWDASIIPMSLGINPLLMISSLSDVLSDVALSEMRPNREATQNQEMNLECIPTFGTISFKEKMAGTCFLRSNGLQIPLGLRLTLNQTQKNETSPHEGLQFQVSGQVDTSADGRFVTLPLSGHADILKTDLHQGLIMNYNLYWKDDSGNEFTLSGTKRVAKHLSHLWSSVTHMPVSIQTREKGSLVWTRWAAGEVNLKFSNVVEIVKSMFLNEPSLKKSMATLHFVNEFRGRLWRNLK